MSDGDEIQPGQMVTIPAGTWARLPGTDVEVLVDNDYRTVVIGYRKVEPEPPG